MRRMWEACAGVLASAGLLAGCGTLPWTSAEATGELAPDQQVGPESTEVAVLVSRAECNNGVTAELLAPDVEVSSEHVVVTFRVTPGDPGEASSPSNELVPFVLELPEPLGDRLLLDGQCEDDDTPGYCATDVRYRPS